MSSAFSRERSRDRVLRTTHVVTDLDVGGAEMVLLRLLERTQGVSLSAEVISLSGEGRLVGPLRDIGVDVKGLPPGLRGRAVAVSAIARELRRSRPDVVQTWMYHGDVFGGLAARWAGIPVVWGIHAAPNVYEERLRFRTRAGLRAAALLSRRVPQKIVCCSLETRRVHERLGYDPRKLVTIPNGFDVNERGGTGDAASLRGELGVGPETPLVGRVGRDHPQKDSATLIKAFSLIRRDIPDALLVLVGEGFVPDNEDLQRLVLEAGLSRSHVVFLGPRTDVPRLHRAFDVVVSSSYSEGLPVVLGEAMSVGTPVVATDVGDSRVLVDDADRIVPPRSPIALANAVTRLLKLDAPSRKRIGDRDRDRIRTEFSLDRMVASYEDLYHCVVEK